jgi:hypothetical protein
MKKTAMSIIAAFLIVLVFLVLNAVCGDCVYARSDSVPVHGETANDQWQSITVNQSLAVVSFDSSALPQCSRTSLKEEESRTGA